MYHTIYAILYYVPYHICYTILCAIPYMLYYTMYYIQVSAGHTPTPDLLSLNFEESLVLDNMLYKVYIYIYIYIYTIYYTIYMCVYTIHVLDNTVHKVHGTKCSPDGWVLTLNGTHTSVETKKLQDKGLLVRCGDR